jgi:DNA polymerase
MDEALRRQYLQAMGVELWEPREAAPQEAPLPQSEPAAAGKPSDREKKPAVKPSAEKMPQPPVDVPAQETPPPDWWDEVPPLETERAETVDRDGEMPLAQPGTVATLGWDALQRRVAECSACALHTSRTNTVFGVGDREARLMVIGEAPGAEEDRKGEPFVGRAGKLLDAMLLAIGLRRNQVFIANILKCRPPDNRDPRPEEALNCEAFLQRQVALVQPEVILAVGRVAAQNLLQSHDAVGRLRGGEHRYQGIPVVVSYHPAYLLRSPEQKAKSWQDLQRAAKLLRQK